MALYVSNVRSRRSWTAFDTALPLTVELGFSDFDPSRLSAIYTPAAETARLSVGLVPFNAHFSCSARTIWGIKTGLSVVKTRQSRSGFLDPASSLARSIPILQANDECAFHEIGIRGPVDEETDKSADRLLRNPVAIRRGGGSVLRSTAARPRSLQATDRGMVAGQSVSRIRDSSDQRDHVPQEALSRLASSNAGLKERIRRMSGWCKAVFDHPCRRDDDGITGVGNRNVVRLSRPVELVSTSGSRWLPCDHLESMRDTNLEAGVARRRSARRMGARAFADEKHSSLRRRSLSITRRGVIAKTLPRRPSETSAFT